MRLVVFECEGVAEVVIKKSRFIGHLLPVTAVEQADMALSAVREAHKTANHNCFAYTIGLGGTPVERFSDDSEPSGTAGRPMLELLRRRDIRNSLVVVTRYFGGTLLGASGLVHAYQDASQAAMEATTALTCVRMQGVRVSCDYATFGKLEHAYAQAEFLVGEKEFSQDVGMNLTITEDDADRLAKMTADLSSGQARVEMDDAAWFGRRPDGSVVRL